MAGAPDGVGQLPIALQQGGARTEVDDLAVEAAGKLQALAREFGLLVSAGSDFHGPSDWSELGLYRPVPDDLPPLWTRFAGAARALEETS